MHAVQSYVSERLKSYPRVSKISLSCTFAGVRFYVSHFLAKHIQSLLYELNSIWVSTIFYEMEEKYLNWKEFVRNVSTKGFIQKP
jgi:hypothetical protein